MAGFIGPMRRGSGFAVACFSHVAGGAAGGVALGGLLAAVAISDAPSDPFAPTCIALLALAESVPGVRVGFRRQVPQTWIERGKRPFVLARYGAALGLGVTTQTSTLLIWALPVLSLTASAASALLAGLTYGASRAAASAALAPALRSPEAACALLSRPRVRYRTAVASALLLATLAGIWHAG